MSLFRKSGVSLSQFVRGMVKSMTDGQQAIPHARDEILKEHMIENDEGVLVPKFHTVEIQPGQKMKIPTFSMSQVNTMGITRVKIQCSARIIGMEREETSGTVSVGDSHAMFTVDHSNGGRDSFNMVIEFEQREPSETEMHLIEALDRLAVVETSD